MRRLAIYAAGLMLFAGCQTGVSNGPLVLMPEGDVPAVAAPVVRDVVRDVQPAAPSGCAAGSAVLSGGAGYWP